MMDMFGTSGICKITQDYVVSFITNMPLPSS
jgi:hypothetical protein